MTVYYLSVLTYLQNSWHHTHNFLELSHIAPKADSSKVALTLDCSCLARWVPVRDMKMLNFHEIWRQLRDSSTINRSKGFLFYLPNKPKLIRLNSRLNDDSYLSMKLILKTHNSQIATFIQNAFETNVANQHFPKCCWEIRNGRKETQWWVQKIHGFQ